jgi:predicted nucleotide-binding protein
MNLTRHHVIKGIVEPYLAGIKFKFENTTFEPSEVADIGIYETDDTWSDFKDVVEYGDDVSDEFIHTSKKKEKDELKTSSTASSKNVFIIHGRDHEPVKELKRMLSDLGLNPIVLHEQASGGLTLAEKLEKYAGKVGFAFAILTPDDFGGQKEEIRKKLGADLPFLQRPIAIFGPQVIDNILKNFEPRARQNVIFETGYFWGVLERKRVCCLLKGNVEKPSDIEGIVYIGFNESVNDAKDMIKKELREAGYEIRK